MIFYLQLQNKFDTEAMQAETAMLAKEYWKAHYNTRHYEGGWNIIPLRSINGETDNILSVHNDVNSKPVYKDTPLLSQCPYLSSVLDFFKCEKTAARLMKLEAGAIIKEHTDHQMNFEEGEVRFHIPVQTNDQVDFFILDEKIPLQEGECWYLNLSLRHRVTNGGSSDRIHLVIDCLVNDWVKEQFALPGNRRKEIDESATGRVFSPEEKKQMIAQLRILNTAVSNELADKLEAEH